MGGKEEGEVVKWLRSWEWSSRKRARGEKKDGMGGVEKSGG